MCGRQYVYKRNIYKRILSIILKHIQKLVYADWYWNYKKDAMAVEYINVFLMGAGGVRAPHNPSQADYLDDSNVVHLARRAVPEQLAANITSMVALQPSTNILVPIIMFSIGMVGNIVAAGVYHCSSSWHRGTAFYGILRGFFLTSIIGYLAVYPVMIAVHVNGLHWIGGPKMCDFHGFAVLTFGMSLAYITGVLGFERFLASCRPLTYNRKVEPRKIPFVLVLLWIVSVFTGILPLVGFGRIHLQYPSTWCFIDWRNDETVGRLFSSVLATIIVSVIVLVIVSIIAATIGAVYRTAKKCRGMVGAKDDDRGRYSLTLTIDDNSRRIPRRFFAADRALMWATLHYDLLASGFLVCYIPVVVSIILFNLQIISHPGVIHIQCVICIKIKVINFQGPIVLKSIDFNICMWPISKEQLIPFPLVPFLHHVCHAWPSTLPLKMTMSYPTFCKFW